MRKNCFYKYKYKIGHFCSSKNVGNSIKREENMK